MLAEDKRGSNGLGWRAGEEGSTGRELCQYSRWMAQRQPGHGVGKTHTCVGNPQQSGMNMMKRVEGGMKGMLWSKHQSPGGSCQEFDIFI